MRRTFGSIPAVGSSSTSMLGSPTNASASDSFLRPQRLVIESRWLSKPPECSGE
jgi:hypothetical protein